MMTTIIVHSIVRSPEEDAIISLSPVKAGANLEATTVLDSFTPLRTAPRQGQSEVLTVRTSDCGQGASSWQADPTFDLVEVVEAHLRSSGRGGPLRAPGSGK